MGIVDQTIEDRVGQRGITHDLVYQRSTGTWLVMISEPELQRSSTISSRSRRCSAFSGSGPQSSRMSRLDAC